MEPSDAVETAIREKAAKLGQFHNNIIGCRVTVEEPHRHHQQGKLFSIHIDVSLPQGNVVVSHDSQDKHAHEDIYVALRDAFDAAYRQLEERQARQSNH